MSPVPGIAGESSSLWVAVLRIAVILLIPPLAVAKRAAHANRHNTQRRYKNHQDRAVDRPLRLLGSALHRLVAHGATLRDRGRRTERKHQREQQSRKLSSRRH